MKTQIIIPAIWVRFTPYLVQWTENEYGTGIEISGHHMLELRPINGIREAMRIAVDEDTNLQLKTRNSMSQLRYDIATAGSDIQRQTDITQKELQAFLPVHVPDYMLTNSGAVRPFSRVMQLKNSTAAFISTAVYNDFWNAVRRFDLSGTFAIDRDMIESFCEENQLPDISIDDLRNQYQRMKRNNYFANKS